MGDNTEIYFHMSDYDRSQKSVTILKDVYICISDYMSLMSRKSVTSLKDIYTYKIMSKRSVTILKYIYTNQYFFIINARDRDHLFIESHPDCHQ